jgi:hypothetical protein
MEMDPLMSANFYLPQPMQAVSIGTGPYRLIAPTMQQSE